MQYVGVITLKMPFGFKAYFWGQANEHLMDWNGTNYRIKAVPGQPRSGFEYREDAERFVHMKYGTEDDAKADCPESDGTHYGFRYERYAMETVKWEAPHGKGIQLRRVQRQGQRTRRT